VGDVLAAEAGEFCNKLSLFSLITGSKLSVSRVMMFVMAKRAGEGEGEGEGADSDQQ